MSVLTFLLVGCGGAAGALCRHKALTFLKPHCTGRFPWPTLAVNLCSCTIAGAALAAWEKIGRGERGDAGSLTPNYLRLSQAERARLEKTKTE